MNEIKEFYVCPMHPEIRQERPGMCPECGMGLIKSRKQQAPRDNNQKVAYTCPMHPEVVQGREGMCPECGMQLVKSEARNTRSEIISKSEIPSSKHSGHKTNIFKAKFWVSLALSIPVVAYSDIVQKLLGYTAPQFPGSQFVPLFLSSIIFFYGGWVFIASAYRELRAKTPGMMTLIALAISVAYVYSVFVVFTGGETLFWELSTLITIMLLGHWMEMRAVTGAQGALKELSKLLPDTAEVMRGGKSEVIPLEEVKTGDVLLVKPGGKIPTDGVVKEGQSEVNESLATGESKPVGKKQGDAVIAGTVNGDGSLTVEVTKIGEDTFLAGVKRLVAEAQASKSKLQLLSDRAAFYLTIVAVVTGGVTLAGWLAASTPAFAIERMVAVLVIACPHALGLAIPLVASISTTKAAQSGFLVKQRLALEAARNIDVVLFDKTGTLTKGEFGVDTVVPTADGDEGGALTIAASVNQHSEHPIARAIVAEAKQKGFRLLDVKNFQRIAGKGAQAEVSGRTVQVGSSTLLADLKLTLENSLREKMNALSQQGKTVIFVIIDNQVTGAIALADIIREESREAITSLKGLGIKTAMITGDSEDVAKWVAGELQIDEYYARVLPGEKAEIIKKIQETSDKDTSKIQITNNKSQTITKLQIPKNKRFGNFDHWNLFGNWRLGFGNSTDRRSVAMVGDGINDAPALTQADLGIAIGAGTNVAIESAGIILVKNDPRDIVKIIRLSKLTYTKMIQNLWWAAGYNIVAIPLAAGVLAFKDIYLQPAVAAAFMSLSTVIVAMNALLLKKKVL